MKEQILEILGQTLSSPYGWVIAIGTMLFLYLRYGHTTCSFTVGSTFQITGGPTATVEKFLGKHPISDYHPGTSYGNTMFEIYQLRIRGQLDSWAYNAQGGEWIELP